MGKNHFMPGDPVDPEKLKQAIDNQHMALPVPVMGEEAIKRKVEARKKAKQRRAVVLKDFKKWANKKHENAYKMYNPIGPLVLIRLYLYEPPSTPKEKVILTSWEDDGTGHDTQKAEMFPFVKVLAVGDNLPEDYSNVIPGDVLLIPDDMCGVEENPEWKEWQFMVREKPSIKDDWPMPPRYIPSLTQWAKYLFRHDKFMSGNINDDIYTFLVPPSMMRCGVDIDELR